MSRALPRTEDAAAAADVVLTWVIALPLLCFADRGGGRAALHWRDQPNGAYGGARLSRVLRAACFGDAALPPLHGQQKQLRQRQLGMIGEGNVSNYNPPRYDGDSASEQGEEKVGETLAVAAAYCNRGGRYTWVGGRRCRYRRETQAQNCRSTLHRTP